MFTWNRLSSVLLTLTLLAPAMSASAADRPPGLPIQLELGDSWTYGDGASDPSSGGYAGHVYRHNLTNLDCLPANSENFATGCPGLQRLTLARQGTADNPGVTTDLFIAEQLDEGVALASARNSDNNPRNDVVTILLSVGGNDVSKPVLQACIGGLTSTCLDVIGERVGHVDENLELILAALREAAGPDASIVILTYDNAIPSCPLGSTPGAGPLGNLVLEGHPGLGVTGLNEVIRSRAAQHDVHVVEVFAALQGTDWVGDCLHPNDSGYEKIGVIAGLAITG